MRRAVLVVLAIALAVPGCRSRGATTDAVTTFAVLPEEPPANLMGTPLAMAPAEATPEPELEDGKTPATDASTAAKDAASGGDGGDDPSVPHENQQQGDPPPVASAEEGARKLLEAIKTDDPSLAADFFFPGPAFDRVKAMENPGTYYKKLKAWYDEDIHTEHERYWGVETFTFDSFEMGKCEWKETLSQGNRIPYWSCRNGRILARSGSKLFDFRIRYVINWGPSWYVIHLGPIRNL